MPADGSERPRGGALLPTASRELLLRELARMAGHGVPLDEALHTLAQSRRQRERDALGAIGKALRDGAPLSRAFGAASPGFDPIEIALIEAAEATGALPAMLTRLADGLALHEEVRRDIRRGVAWPLFVAASAVVLLPFPTLITHGVGAFLTEAAGYLFGLVLPAVLVVVGGPRLLARPDVRDRLIPLAERVPGVRRWVRSRRYSLFFDVLAASLGCGLPLPGALRLSGRATDEHATQKAVERVIVGIDRGEGLARAVRRLPGIDDTSLTRLATGEKTGDLAAAAATQAALFRDVWTDTTRRGAMIARGLLSTLITLAVALALFSQMQRVYTNPLSMLPESERKALERDLGRSLPGLFPGTDR